MPEFSANISLLFREYDFIDRIQAASDAGFKAVEMQFPYRYPLDELCTAVARAGVGVVLINAPIDDEEKRMGVACLPQYQSRFKTDIDRIYEYAGALGVRHVNVLAGVPDRGLQRGSCLSLLQDNLMGIAEKLQVLDVNVLLEPINQVTLPGYLVSNYDEAKQLLARCGLPNLGLQFDIFHAVMMGLDYMDTLRTNLDCISHIQFADVPGRHEPGTGDIPFRQVFSLIDALGYRGWLGAEYHPKQDTLSSLGWFKDYGNADKGHSGETLQGCPG